MPKNAPRKDQFAREYLLDLNSQQAAVRCGYSKRSAAQQGSRLLKDVKIKAEIDREMALRSQKTGISAQRVVQELARIGLADVRDVMSWDAAGVTFIPSADLSDDAARGIQSVKSRERTSVDNEGNASVVVELEVKMHPKEPALNLLARHLGMLKDPMADGLAAVADAMRKATIAAAQARARRR